MGGRGRTHLPLFLLPIQEEVRRCAEHQFACCGPLSDARPPFPLGILCCRCQRELPLAKHLPDGCGGETLGHQFQECLYGLGVQGRRLVLHDGPGICLLEADVYYAEPQSMGAFRGVPPALDDAVGARQTGHSHLPELLHAAPPPVTFEGGRTGLLDQYRLQGILGQLQRQGFGRLLPALLLPRV